MPPNTIGSRADQVRRGSFVDAADANTNQNRTAAEAQSCPIGYTCGLPMATAPVLTELSLRTPRLPQSGGDGWRLVGRQVVQQRDVAGPQGPDQAAAHPGDQGIHADRKPGRDQRIRRARGFVRPPGPLAQRERIGIRHTSNGSQLISQLK